MKLRNISKEQHIKCAGDFHNMRHNLFALEKQFVAFAESNRVKRSMLKIRKAFAQLQSDLHGLLQTATTPQEAQENGFGNIYYNVRLLDCIKKEF
jgi:hypothetical protein